MALDGDPLGYGCPLCTGASQAQLRRRVGRFMASLDAAADIVHKLNDAIGDPDDDVPMVGTIVH